MPPKQNKTKSSKNTKLNDFFKSTKKEDNKEEDKVINLEVKNLNSNKSQFINKFEFYSKLKDKNLLELKYFSDIYNTIEEILHDNMVNLDKLRLESLFNYILKRIIFEKNILWNNKYEPYCVENILEIKKYKKFIEFLENAKIFNKEKSALKNILIANCESGDGIKTIIELILKIENIEYYDFDIGEIHTKKDIINKINKKVKFLNVVKNNIINKFGIKRIIIIKYFELYLNKDTTKESSIKNIFDNIHSENCIFIILLPKRLNYAFKLKDYKTINFNNKCEKTLNMKFIYFYMIIFLEKNLEFFNSLNLSKIDTCIIDNYNYIWDNNIEILNNYYNNKLIKENFILDLNFLKSFFLNLDFNINSILIKAQFNINAFFVGNDSINIVRFKNTGIMKKQILYSQYLIINKNIHKNLLNYKNLIKNKFAMNHEKILKLKEEDWTHFDFKNRNFLISPFNKLAYRYYTKNLYFETKLSNNHHLINFYTNKLLLKSNAIKIIKFNLNFELRVFSINIFNPKNFLLYYFYLKHLNYNKISRIKNENIKYILYLFNDLRLDDILAIDNKLNN